MHAFLLFSSRSLLSAICLFAIRRSNNSYKYRQYLSMQNFPGRSPLHDSTLVTLANTPVFVTTSATAFLRFCNYCRHSLTCCRRWSIVVMLSSPWCVLHLQKLNAVLNIAFRIPSRAALVFAGFMNSSLLPVLATSRWSHRWSDTLMSSFLVKSFIL